ncbi:heme biosynthesis HemY N-terminal domain-containing protein [Pseudohongiella sp. SYSU M77423]|uniref:heme biosynthesis HemY N-terminal domain-containing protein n=1 Tax=unclassified Pseudohongiella TaxID=2629611 RepID=UPI001F30E3A1|nr:MULTISPECIES: heme biosynthesis HemY N-terminal domain-containing protein [unclassified Pseudohongiella]MDH7942733.1 heme biosynthesis HemY N-terminal domain-containing protein [Pseudohongiella sp. SYSU M77423]MEC8860469.1 heme biosynthesis HemY N-terminal domain-containing protein [Pseudomonadota bacterium]
MKKTFILILLALIAGVALAIQLARDPGYLLIAYGDYTFETSLFALLVAIILLLIIVKLILSLFRWLNPMRLFRSGDSRPSKRSRSSL